MVEGARAAFSRCSLRRTITSAPTWMEGRVEKRDVLPTVATVDVGECISSSSEVAGALEYTFKCMKRGLWGMQAGDREKKRGLLVELKEKTKRLAIYAFLVSVTPPSDSYTDDYLCRLIS